MRKFALVSPIALAFGLALTGAAAAQVMVGDQEVRDEDMLDVQTHCEALATAASTAASPNEATVQLDELANQRTGVELTTITVQQCIDAGLIDGPVPGLTPTVTTAPGTDDSADDGEDDEIDDITND
ncbi:hypothetical protein [Pelagibacterium limicola]|uniref:hypothetical protein n=1 Tax=Pelagibacterium limicola TaxID=2791022 RepID=UPI0018AFCDB3|nr:hypothetical protein [Pelagibacterium limicola]